MKKRLCVLLLAAMLLLSGCGVDPTQPGKAPEAPENAVKLAYIPLDDRPNNYECMLYMAQSLDYELLMPETELFRTRLDGQPGAEKGDRAALYEWLLDCEEQGCDRYIIFLDQLLSGGLCASRSASSDETVTLSDGRTVTDRELLEMTIKLLSSDKNNRVWLLDTVMRLAPTVGYAGWTLDDYYSVREYFAQPRLLLPDAELTPGNIVSAYGMSPDGGEIPLSCVDADDIKRCTDARQRKLLLAQELFMLLHGDESGVFTVLYGIDDSSESNCVQVNEIAYIRTLLRRTDALLSGVDDMGFKALAAMYLNDTDWQGTPAELRYFGGAEDENACEFDYRPLSEIVSEHMDFFGLEESASAQLKIYVLTKPEDPERAQTYCDELIDALNDSLSDGDAVILMDASNGAYGDTFRTALVNGTEFGKLVAYAGQLDLANLTGTALGHGVARYAYLKNGECSELSGYGHMCSLADVLVKDICYRNNARASLSEYIRTELSGNPDNLWATNTSPDAANAELCRLMDGLVPQLLEKLQRCNFISSLAPYSESGWGGVAIKDYRLPWYRSFEISFAIEVGKATQPHKSLLGIYYK